MSFVNRAQSEHDDTLPSCSPFIISSPDPDVTFSATFDPTTSPAANFPLTPLDQTPLEQATPAVELYDDGDAAFLSQSSSAYTVDSRCEFLNVKQSEASKNKAMKKLRADEKKMRIREEEVAVRNALCDAGIKPEDLERDCGLGSCRPRACHGCANIKMFIFTLCVFSTLSGMMIPGYLNSVITTIETRFQIGSSISGIIAASVEFGSLVAVIFVSYFGGNRHIPKWIGCGAILKGIGSIMFIIPHLATDRYSLYDAGLNTTDDNICRTPDEHSRLNCVDDQSGNAVLVVVLIIAQILVGTGGSPLFTLGTTYIDNHVSKEKSPAYLSFVYATSALGPVCGFALGALMLQFYVDFTTVDPAALGITPADPRWVGAWWLGFVVGGILLLIMAIPMFAFPKVMHAEKARLYLEQKQADPTQRGTYNATASDTLMRRASTETAQQQQQQPDEQYGRRLQDIPSATYNLIANPIYLVTCFGICCEIIIVSGFIVFLPKFLETQFGMTKSVANLLTGGIAIPAAVVGIMVGGYLLKRFQMTPKDAVQMMLALNFLGVLGFSLLIFLGCDNVRMAGATLPYFNSSGHEILEANLTSPCNMDCSCSSNSLEPVCGINGITYFSACHAGCTQMYASQEMTRLQNYSDCACILGNMNLGQEVIMSPMATGGPCKVTCQTLTPFMVLLFFMTLLVAGTHMPLLMLTLRSVREEERSFALGMQFVILRLFAYIPAPIMFGNTIDSTCLLWKEHCGQQGGCLMYDIVMFRFKYIGISAGLKLLAAVFFIALYYLIKQQDMQDFKRPMMIGDLVKSVTSLASGVDVDSALAHRHHGTFHQRKGHRRSKSTGCQPTVQDLDLSAAIYNTDRSPGPRSPGTQSLGGTIHYPKSRSQSNVNAPTVHFQITKPGVESAL